MRANLVSRCSMLLLAAAVGAQEMVWRTTGTPGARRIGRQILAVGDLNQDGYEDLMTIVTGACGLGSVFNGHLWLLSGMNGTLLREVSLPGTSDVFLSVGSAGDWDDDGVPDYVTSVGYFTVTGVISRTEVRSGANDSLLLDVPPTGEVVMADLDLDGDGLNDLIVADEHPYNYLGELYAYSHGGQLLYHLVGNVAVNPPLQIAVCAAKLGDIDDDGCDDFVMECFEPTGRGASVIVSGKTGDYIRICYGELPGDALCVSNDACGDVDGDGYQDFVVGNGGGSFVTRGVMQVFSSRTGQMLQQWTAPANSEFSLFVASRGVDFDGDSIPDMTTGSLETGGDVHAFSGRDGSTLHHWTSASIPSAGLYLWKTTLQPPGQHTGWIIVAEVNSGGGCGSPLGSVTAYRGAPRSTQFLGTPCAGNLTSAPVIGLQSRGTAGVRVPLSGAPPNVPSLLLLGASWINPGVPLPFALDPLGWPGCFLRTSIVVTFPVVTGSTGIDAGYAFVNLPWPVATGGGGLTLSAQWLVFGDATTWPGGLTQAVKWWW